MNELTLSNRAAGWHRLKALVLDSVSSPIGVALFQLGEVPVTSTGRRKTHPAASQFPAASNELPHLDGVGRLTCRAAGCGRAPLFAPFPARHCDALGGFWGDPAVHGWGNSGKDG